MKKTTAIQLVLITAALAACNRPLYPQQTESDDPGYTADADAPDATNSCPIESADLPPDYYSWLYGPGSYGSLSVNFNIVGFYNYRYHAVAGRTALYRPVADRLSILRSGFGARFGAAVHS